MIIIFVTSYKINSNFWYLLHLIYYMLIIAQKFSKVNNQIVEYHT